MKLIQSFAVVGLVGMSVFACSASEEGDVDVGEDSVRSRLSVNEQRSAALDSNGICRTTCKDSSGKTLMECRAGLFADPAFCTYDENICKKADTISSFCRNPNGQFAFAECCTSVCQGSRLTKDRDVAGLYHCRAANGAFTFAACCNKTAQGLATTAVK